MSAPDTTPTQAALDRAVVAHVARRLRENADAQWLFGFATTTFELVVAAEARAHGLDPKASQRRLLDCTDPAEAQIPALRERVERLETLLDERAPGWRNDPEPKQQRLFSEGSVR